MAKLDLFIARKPFFFYPEPGQPVRVLPGAVARKGHPVIDAEPDAWAELTVDFEVEKKPAEARASVPDGKGTRTRGNG